MGYPGLYGDDTVSVYVYAKTTEDMHVFELVLEEVTLQDEQVYITVENRRCGRELEAVKRLCTYQDKLVASSLASLGMNEAEIANQLEWFIEKSIPLVLCEEPSTYEFGVTQPTNKAVLSALLRNTLNGKDNILKLPVNRKTNAGRNRIEFPDDWAELYEQWEDKRITSGEFLKKTGLKKATFYNMITEYRELKQANEGFGKKYQILREA